MVDPWRMTGSEGTGEYVVLLRTWLGRLGLREVPGAYRVRIEPSPRGRELLDERVPHGLGWKRPGDGEQDRYSVVVRREDLPRALGIATAALEAQGARRELNPAAPDRFRLLLPSGERGGIFLSYRRADSASEVARMYDSLVRRFSESSIFRDVDSLPLGRPFPEALEDALKRTRVGLVVIGPTWTSVADERGARRLDDPQDFVRREVESLLSLGVPVVPCMVSRAPFPRPGDIPAGMRTLLDLEGVEIRPDPEFQGDMDRFRDRLTELLFSDLR